MPKYLRIIIVLVSFLILVGLIRQIIGTLEAGKRLDKLADEVSTFQEKNNKLQAQLENAQKYEFIEKVARDKLNLSKPEEIVVIIQDEDINKIINAQKPTPQPKIPNWQGWLKLFVR